jgi:hypothetical protein
MPNLNCVQWLTIGEVAELWTLEIEVPTSVIEREMRIAIHKSESGLPFRDPIASPPNEMPSAETLVDVEFLREFSAKQCWAFPRFWAAHQPQSPSFPGRPTVMHLILQELEAKAARGELEPTLAAQARTLRIWSEANLRSVQIPRAKSIENGIRVRFRQLLNAH